MAKYIVVNAAIGDISLKTGAEVSVEGVFTSEKAAVSCMEDLYNKYLRKHKDEIDDSAFFYKEEADDIINCIIWRKDGWVLTSEIVKV